jgi:hypothetical protein
MVWTKTEVKAEDLIAKLHEHIDDLDGESIAELATQLFDPNYEYIGKGIFEKGENDV